MKYNLLKFINKLTNKFQFFPLFIAILLCFSLANSDAQADTVITNTATANFSINGITKTQTDSIQFTKDTIVTPTNIIKLTKQTSDSAFLGDSIVYTLTVNNPNSNSLNNVIIHDTLPPGLIFQDNSVKLNYSQFDQNNVTLLDNLLSINIGSIPANSQAIVTYQARTTREGILVNQAYVQSDTANSTKAISSIEIKKRPIIPLNLTKQVNKKRVKAGDTIHYLLVITNKNEENVESIILNDSLPSQLDYIIGSATLENNKIVANTSNGLSFNIGNIPAYTSWTLQYDARLKKSSNGSSFTNIAKATTAKNTEFNSNTAKVTTEISHDIIKLSKIANEDKVIKGDTLLYTINISNPQNHSLSNIILNDHLPVGFIYKTGTAKIDNFPLSSVRVNGSNLVFTINSLDKKENTSITYEVLVTEDAALGEAINTINASSDYAVSSIASSSVKVSTNIPLSLTKQVDKKRIKPDSTLHYVLKITNKNDRKVLNAILNDSLPSQLSYITGSAKLNNNKIIANLSNGLAFVLGDIPASTSWTLEYDAVSKSESKSGLITNTAKVIAKKIDSNIAKATTEISNYTIDLNKTVNQNKALTGESLLYTVTVSNPQNQSLSNIVLNDILPTGFIYKSGTAKIDNTPLSSVQIKGSNLIFLIDSLKNKQKIVITYEVLVTDNATVGKAINSVSASSDFATSPVVSSSVYISKSIPLILKKQADKKRINAGDSIHYRLKITNKNKKAIKDTKLHDTLPSQLSYTIGSARLDNKKIEVVNTSNELMFSIANIPADTSLILEYDTKSTSSSKGMLINTAKIIAKNIKVNSNTDKASTEISSDKIKLAKTVNKDRVKTGETLLYTIYVSNPQNHSLTNIILNDHLPTGFIYEKGSAKINDSLLKEIQVEDSNLTFSINSLKKKQSISITYKVLVTKDAIPGEAINTVNARSDYAVSSTVSSSVQVRTPSSIEFLKIDKTSNNTKSIIPSTSFNNNKNGGKQWENIEEITLRDGTIVDFKIPQPLIKTEKYTLSDPIIIKVTDKDQNTDPKKIDTIIIDITAPGTGDKEVLLLRETAPNSGIFIGVLATTTSLAENQNGALSLSMGSRITVSYYDEEDQTDISATAALIIPDTQLILNKTSNKQSASIGEQILYTLNFKNTSDYDIPNLVIKDTLPIGFKLLPSSSKLNDSKSINNIKINGRHLIFNLGKMKTGETWKFEYLTKITSGVQVNDAINTARIDSGKFTSNLAKATINIKDDLMSTKNILTGRVFVGCKSIDKNPKILADARIYLETGRSVLSDKEGFWHMEGVNPGSHVLQIDADSLPDGYTPIICNENTRNAKNSKSKFVNLQAGSSWHVNFHVQKSNTLATVNKKIIKNNDIADPAKLFNAKYLENTSSDFEILWPKNNYVPAVASTKIYIKSSPKQKVEVYLNGKKVSALNYDGSDTNRNRTATIRRWFGVDIDIKRKNNTLVAILKNRSGKEIMRKTHNIHFSSNPAYAEFIEEKSVLIADGKTTPIITLRIKDEDGYPMRANTHGYFTLNNSSFSIKTQQSNDGELNLNESISGSYKYRIEEGGITHIELNPTNQSGQIKLELNFPKSKNKVITAWLKPQLRNWILVGIAEGTIAHKTISGNIETLKDLDKADRVYKQGRIAFFAKGKIKGKYLLTLAYDSHKKKHEAGYQLNGDIDPDSWYTIYADNSHSQYGAPSSRKLYLKIEKDTFYTLFGDYRTGMNVVELAKFERTLNGLKSKYKGRNLSYTAFISETSNHHHLDEIPGDGTSGLYYLSNSIIPNSEIIRIETRDRFHSEKILEARNLVRFQDYEIDYDNGTLFFKSPITGRDSNFNPNIIVINYDSESDSNKNIVTGGRVAINTDNEKLEVGISAIKIGHNNVKDDSLVALDATYKIDKSTEIHAEIAQSKTQKSEYNSLQAQVIELEKTISKIEAKLYYRKLDDNFGIDSQISELGTKKIGAELKYRINSKTIIDSELSKQNNLLNNSERKLAEIKLKHRYKQYEFNTGIRHTEETTSQETEKVDTFLVGGKYTTRNNKITLHGNLEKNLTSNNDSEHSPDRALIGIDLKLKQGLTLFAEHEISDSDSINTQNTRIGISKNLWIGAKARTTITQERTDQGQRNYATIGLTQHIKLSNKIRADFSLDHAKTITDKERERFNDDEARAQGSQRDDYTAFSVGLGSNDKDWSWSTRLELRDGEITDKVNFRASVLRRLSNGKNLNSKLSYTKTKNANGEYTTTSKISFGLAWHPKEKDFIVFSRLDLSDEKSNNDSNSSHTQKVIHNIHFNRKINKTMQFSIHHGIKHLVDENNQSKTHTTIDTATLELRKDIGKKWDIGAHLGYLHDWTEKNISSVAGVSIGTTPAKNAWLQIGYNFEGFDDTDFDENNYRRKGAYLSFSYKFDQDSFRQKHKKVKPKNNH